MGERRNYAVTAPGQSPMNLRLTPVEVKVYLGFGYSVKAVRTVAYTVPAERRAA